MDSSKEEILKKIDRLITIKADNTITNHFRYTCKYFFDWNNENIIGQTNFDSFVLWQYNRFWGGIFYPVIYGTFEIKDNKEILLLKSRLNFIGKLLNGIIIAMIAYATLSNSFIATGSSIKIDFPMLMFSIIMIALFQTVPFFAYRMTRKGSIKFIKEYLNK